LRARYSSASRRFVSAARSTTARSADHARDLFSLFGQEPVQSFVAVLALRDHWVTRSLADRMAASFARNY
jgi:hypothetical protein